MEHDEISQILRTYGADEDVLWEYHCQPTRLRIVRDVLKVRTATGQFALKKVYMPVERLEHVYQISEHIHRGGMAHVPRFIKSRYGDAYVVHPTGVYYMTAWFNGREADIRKPSHWLCSAELLATWHLAANAFHAGGPWRDAHQGQSPSNQLRDGIGALHVLQSSMRESTVATPFVKYVAACADELREQGELALARFGEAKLADAEADAWRRGEFCHGSFVKKNILYNGSDYALVHYDRVYPGPHLYDIAIYLHRYMPAYEWNSDALDTFVRTYEETLGTQFDDDWWQRLGALLSAPLRPLQIVTWYLNRAVAWSEADFVDAMEWAMELEHLRERSVECVLANKMWVSERGRTTGSGASTLPIDLAALPATVPLARPSPSLAPEPQPPPSPVPPERAPADVGVAAPAVVPVAAGSVQRKADRRKRRGGSRSRLPTIDANVPQTFGQVTVPSARRLAVAARVGQGEAAELAGKLRAADKHRREDDKQQQQNDEVERGRPKDGAHEQQNNGHGQQ